jgi:ketosteroid isomerase-like protein
VGIDVQQYVVVDFDQVVEQYHFALAEFAKGNPGPANALLSRRGDVSLAGGFGGVTRGWEDVSKNIEFASSQFKQGRISFENLAKYATQDLGYIVEIERYEAKLFGTEDVARNVLRVTSVFRREDGVWKLLHRHGDPIPAMLALIQAVPKTVVSIKKAD